MATPATIVADRRRRSSVARRRFCAFEAAAVGEVATTPHHPCRARGNGHDLPRPWRPRDELVGALKSRIVDDADEVAQMTGRGPWHRDAPDQALRARSWRP